MATAELLSGDIDERLAASILGAGLPPEIIDYAAMLHDDGDFSTSLRKAAGHVHAKTAEIRFLRVHKAAERDMAGRLYRVLQSHKDAILRLLADQYAGYSPSALSPTLLYRAGDSDDELVEAIGGVMSVAAERGARLALESYNRAVRTEKSLFRYRADGRVLLAIPQRIKDAVKRGLRAVLEMPYFRKIGQETRRRLGSVIQQGIEGHESVSGIAERIAEDKSGIFDWTRAKRIARTETTNALGLGAHETETELIVDDRSSAEGRRWLTVGDMDVRDHHVFAHEQQVRYRNGKWRVLNPSGESIDTGPAFVMGNGERARWPGDPTLSAALRINCRCLTVTVLEGEVVTPVPAELS